ncbi:hypothetical protein HLH26_12725 [Gluconacetobacter sp. 1b LMG 1731]|uniref:Uncharacterized protein n=1 Tax=Gluconacetobacter dulcium TaxID=2729096 RepID=A0A7W4IM41_9PROT|nr:hypothetical protein [Gluconacetobacter dulcium]MBB2165381.1 hypothetical protein [Gluconacetobacter dulcium]MBB2194452.1 hypothetical protein [Gluconacetobacter dulcium]
MTDLLATAGLSLRHMALLGLLHPVDNEAWSADERATFRSAAKEVWEADAPFTVVSCPHLAKAREIVNAHDAGWWPELIVPAGLDRMSRLRGIDLTVPALWGAVWLGAMLAAVPDTPARDWANEAIDYFYGIASERLEELRGASIRGLSAENSEELDSALRNVREALPRVAPIWVFGPLYDPGYAET